MLRTTEAFRVDLVDVLRARRPCGEPAVLRHDLESTDGLIITRGADQAGGYRVAGKFSGLNVRCCQAGQGGLPRTTHGMASLPQVPSPKPGDIVLANGNSHGAIYIGNGQVISATTSGGVRVHGLHESWHKVTTYHRAG